MLTRCWVGGCRRKEYERGKGGREDAGRLAQDYRARQDRVVGHAWPEATVSCRQVGQLSMFSSLRSVRSTTQRWSLRNGAPRKARALMARQRLYLPLRAADD